MLDERFLHRMQSPAGGQARGGGDVSTRHPRRGDDARVHGLAVEQHRARAAIAGVAALLDLEVPCLAQQRAKALTRAGAGVDLVAVDPELHVADPAISSDLNSSASTMLTARRQSAGPSGSV